MPSQTKREYDAAYYKANRERVRARNKAYHRLNPDKALARNRKINVTVRGRACQLWFGAKRRAKQFLVPFTITREWVEERLSAQTCELTGRTLVLDGSDSDTHFHPFAPSIDRKHSRGGYTPENCRIICIQANLAISGFGVDALLSLADDIKKHRQTHPTETA